VTTADDGEDRSASSSDSGLSKHNHRYFSGWNEWVPMIVMIAVILGVLAVLVAAHVNFNDLIGGG